MSNKAKELLRKAASRVSELQLQVKELQEQNNDLLKQAGLVNEEYNRARFAMKLVEEDLEMPPYSWDELLDKTAAYEEEKGEIKKQALYKEALARKRSDVVNLGKVSNINDDTAAKGRTKFEDKFIKQTLNIRS